MKNPLKLDDEPPFPTEHNQGAARTETPEASAAILKNVFGDAKPTPIREITGPFSSASDPEQMSIREARKGVPSKTGVHVAISQPGPARPAGFPLCVYAAVFCGKEMANPAELKKFAELEKRCAVFAQQLSLLDNDAHRKIQQAARDAYLDDPTPDNLAKFEQVADKDALMARIRQKRLLVKTVRATFYAAEVVPFLNEITGRAARMMKAELETVEAAEKATAARLALIYVQSQTVRSLETIVQHLSNLKPMGTDPAAFLKGILDLKQAPAAKG